MLSGNLRQEEAVKGGAGELKLWRRWTRKGSWSKPLGRHQEETLPGDSGFSVWPEEGRKGTRVVGQLPPPEMSSSPLSWPGVTSPNFQSPKQVSLCRLELQSALGLLASLLKAYLSLAGETQEGRNQVRLADRHIPGPVRRSVLQNQ